MRKAALALVLGLVVGSIAQVPARPAAAQVEQPALEVLSPTATQACGALALAAAASVVFTSQFNQLLPVSTNEVVSTLGPALALCAQFPPVNPSTCSADQQLAAALGLPELVPRPRPVGTAYDTAAAAAPDGAAPLAAALMCGPRPAEQFSLPALPGSNPPAATALPTDAEGQIFADETTIPTVQGAIAPRQSRQLRDLDASGPVSAAAGGALADGGGGGGDDGKVVLAVLGLLALAGLWAFAGGSSGSAARARA